jgi:hypothetical protein
MERLPMPLGLMQAGREVAADPPAWLAAVAREVRPASNPAGAVARLARCRNDLRR